MSDQEVISLPVKNRGRGGVGGGAEVCNENEQCVEERMVLSTKTIHKDILYSFSIHLYQEI